MEPKKKKNILIIDDEQPVRDLFIRTLQPGGLDIVAVADPDEGMEAAKQFEPDIVYMSLLFPGSNGLKVSKSLHSMERMKEVPIVVLISYQGELDPKYTRTIGIVDVLVKPLKPADILAMTSRLLGEEITAGSDEAAGMAAEETAEELSAPAGAVDPSFAGGSVEGWSEEPEPSSRIEKRSFLDAAEGIEDAEIRQSSQVQPAGRKDGSSPDFGVEHEVREDSFASSDVRPEEESEAGGFMVTEGNPPGDAEDEEEGKREWSDFEVPPETGKKNGRKYFLFAALVLLVAAAVFAALWVGIIPGGGRKGNLFSPQVTETPVVKETVREVAPPEKVEGENNKAAEVQSARQKSGGEGLAASPSPKGGRETSAAVPSVQRAAGTETKAVNERLKEPKTSKGPLKGIYSVQVGVFGKESNAISFAKKLKEKGYDVFVEKDRSGGLHRVLVGRFVDYGKAHGQAEALLKNDGIKSVIYRR